MKLLTTRPEWNLQAGCQRKLCIVDAVPSAMCILGPNVLNIRAILTLTLSYKRNTMAKKLHARP